MRHESIGISGMACPACAKGIERVVRGLRGVGGASIDFYRGEMSLEYDERKLPRQPLLEMISEIARDVAEQARRVTYSAPAYGLRCLDCAARLEGILEKRKGVVSASVSVKDERVRVVYDPRRVDPRHIKSVVENALCDSRTRGERLQGGGDPCGCGGWRA
jgi:copper chaperone CopZ